MDKAIKTYISVLKAEIEHLKSLLEPHDTGHIHTDVLGIALIYIGVRIFNFSTFDEYKEKRMELIQKFLD